MKTHLSVKAVVKVNDRVVVLNNCIHGLDHVPRRKKKKRKGREEGTGECLFMHAAESRATKKALKPEHLVMEASASWWEVARVKHKHGAAEAIHTGCAQHAIALNV